MEKLDSFSKILLATQSINYMSNVVNAANQQIKVLPDEEGIFTSGIKDRDALLDIVIYKLSDIMQDLGDYMNNSDCISPIDERITEQAFKIVIYGKNNTDL
jgi:hypothetical protein